MAKEISTVTKTYAEALHKLHCSSVLVLDAVREQFQKDCSLDTSDASEKYFQENWTPLFEAIETRLKKEIGDAVSEHALNAACGNEEAFAL